MPRDKYKRVLLKLSGEQLSGDEKVGVSPRFISWLADEIKKARKSGVEIAVVIGGGNMVRGAEVAGHGVHRATADHMGMLSGLINAIAVTDIFESHGIQTRCLSNIFADQVAEDYSNRRADKHLKNGRVVLLCGGLGRPYFTHDTAAVNLALELECDVMLKATKVDGVYDKDPVKNGDARRFESLTYQEALESPAIKVMDKAALGLAMEHKMPVIVFDLKKEGNIADVIEGKEIGTIVS